MVRQKVGVVDGCGQDVCRLIFNYKREIFLLYLQVKRCMDINDK